MAASVFSAANGDYLAAPTLSDMALSWIDHDAQARVILEPDLHILWGNAAARARLARRKDLEVRGGRLAATDPSNADALRDYVFGSSAAVSTWCLPCGDGDGHLLFRCQRIAWGEEAAYGLTFFPSGMEWAPRYADLDTVFKLTRAEHRVLLDLLDGHDAESLSSAQGTSIETARTHIRRIYDKLGVNSREALCRRAAPFRL